MKKLTLKNTFFIRNESLGIISLAQWLAQQMLHGKESRARTRFLKLIEERINEIDAERLRLAEEHAEKKKDKEGNEQLVYLDKDGKETTDKSIANSFKVKDMDKFNKEYEDYLNETLVVDVTPANQETIYGVRDIIMDTKEVFSGPMATMYDEWCESFENIK